MIRELRDAGIDRLVLDLRELTFIDSSGLHVIVALHRRAGEEGSELTLIPGPPAVGGCSS